MWIPRVTVMWLHRLEPQVSVLPLVVSTSPTLLGDPFPAVFAGRSIDRDEHSCNFAQRPDIYNPGHMGSFMGGDGASSTILERNSSYVERLSRMLPNGNAGVIGSCLLMAHQEFVDCSLCSKVKLYRG